MEFVPATHQADNGFKPEESAECFSGSWTNGALAGSNDYFSVQQAWTHDRKSESLMSSVGEAAIENSYCEGHESMPPMSSGEITKRTITDLLNCYGLPGEEPGSPDSSLPDSNQLFRPGGDPSARPARTLLVGESEIDDRQHGSEGCKPCYWFLKSPHGCSKGDSCWFCHLCDEKSYSKMKAGVKTRAKVRKKLLYRQLRDQARQSSGLPATHVPAHVPSLRQIYHGADHTLATYTSSSRNSVDQRVTLCASSS